MKCEKNAIDFFKLIVQITRCKEVDWLTFLTTRFFDSVIAHIRLYRKTKIKLNQKNSDIEDSVVNTSENFVATFFELEQSHCIKKIGRRRISTNSYHETGFET